MIKMVLCLLLPALEAENLLCLVLICLQSFIGAIPNVSVHT